MGGRDDHSFGELLRGMRTAAGLTQDELAERAGMSVRGLRYLEQGARRPYSDTVRRVADALGSCGADREALLTYDRRPAPTGIAAFGLRRAGSLPAQASPLIGREPELADLQRLLTHDDLRVVTLTGPGGVGKTRLAVEVATRLQERFAETAWVALASLHDPDLVPAAIGRAFGVVQTGSLADAERSAICCAHALPC
jgi:transcriptional regulator with XRE-family HTH domain